MLSGNCSCMCKIRNTMGEMVVQVAWLLKFSFNVSYPLSQHGDVELSKQELDNAEWQLFLYVRNQEYYGGDDSVVSGAGCLEVFNIVMFDPFDR